MKFSVVIATWNEGSQISSSLKRLRQISQTSPVEIIVVDGGSSDGTAELAREWADIVLEQEKPNRGAQLDAGAKKASGDLLLFLRPDAQPPGNWQQALEHFWLASHPQKIAATAFAIDYGAGPSLRLASRLTNASVSWRGAVSGDHGLATTPEIYREAGGYPPLAFYEDIVFSQRLGKLGRVVLLRDKIWPAARRLHRFGPLRAALGEAWLALRFKLGANPEELWKRDAGL